MNLYVKKEGAATIPIAGFFMILMAMTMFVYMSYTESRRICYRIDDAVTMSLQGVCLFDQYEYSTGSMSGKEIVCFYPGSEDIGYVPGNNIENLSVTKAACVYAYECYLRVLKSNMPGHYVIVPPESAGGLSGYIKKFEMVNVYDDVAYVYDIVRDTTRIVTPASGLKSKITVEMEIAMQFPIYGDKVIHIDETGKLESRIN